MLGRIAILLVVIASAIAAAPAIAQERVALVIGNGRYLHASALLNPANDARAMATALNDIGFDVSQGTDLDRTGMERLMRDFLRKASGAKVVLMFYAGHGMQIDGRNYLVPVDARLETPSDLNFETIELDRLLDNLNDPQRASIVMLDACRDNPLARSFATKLGAARSGAVGTGLAAYANPGTGTLIAFATAPGKVALDGQGDNSPFTLGLIKHLRTPGLEVRQLLTRVRKDVADATGNRQVPWDNSSLLGDVFLSALPLGQVSRTPESHDPAPRPLPQAALPTERPPAQSSRSDMIRYVFTRGYNGSQFVEAGFRRDDRGNWTETQRTDPKAKFRFAEQRNTPAEILLHDDLRDLSLRFDLNAKRLYFRHGTGAWVPFYRIEMISPTASN